MKLLNNSFKIDKSLTKKRPDKTGRFSLWLYGMRNLQAELIIGRNILFFMFYLSNPLYFYKKITKYWM